CVYLQFPPRAKRLGPARLPKQPLRRGSSLKDLVHELVGLELLMFDRVAALPPFTSLSARACRPTCVVLHFPLREGWGEGDAKLDSALTLTLSQRERGPMLGLPGV